MGSIHDWIESWELWCETQAKDHEPLELDSSVPAVLERALHAFSAPLLSSTACGLPECVLNQERPASWEESDSRGCLLTTELQQQRQQVPQKGDLGGESPHLSLNFKQLYCTTAHPLDQGFRWKR